MQRQMLDSELAQQRHHFRLFCRAVQAARGALGDDDRLQHMQMHARR